MRIGSRGVWWVCGLVACWLAAGARNLHAQAASGELTGIVKDQAGSPVPGVTVTVTGIATNRQRQRCPSNPLEESTSVDMKWAVHFGVSC